MNFVAAKAVVWSLVNHQTENKFLKNKGFLALLVSPTATHVTRQKGRHFLEQEDSGFRTSSTQCELNQLKLFLLSVLEWERHTVLEDTKLSVTLILHVC